MSKILPALCLIFLFSLPAQATNPSPLRMADESGDTFGVESWQPDLADFTVTYSSGNLLFLVRFHNDVGLTMMDWNYVLGYIVLDLDQNSATGGDYLSGDTPYTFDLGAEYIIRLRGGGLGRAPVIYFGNLHQDDSSSPGSPSFVDRYEVYQIDGRSFQFTIPLSDLDNDDGKMNTAIVVGSELEATDVIPNGGYNSSERVVPTPSLSEWGMALMAALLGVSLVLSRRRVA